MLDKRELILGIDLGGTKIVSAVVDDRGAVLSRDQSLTPAAQGPGAVIEMLVSSGRRALERAGISAADVASIGVGAPGLVNAQTGIVHTSPNLPGWQDVPLRDVLEQELGKKVFVINDAKAAAVGELKFGAGRGCRHFVYITISTGIGGGIIIDGQIYTGATGMAGEIGHMVIDDAGPLCSCGNRGCWEMLASGTALAREARRSIESGASTTILNKSGGDINKIDARLVHAAAIDGDGLAVELIQRTAYYIGVGLANVINIFNPERIVIGGGLANIGDMLLKPAYEEAGRRAFMLPFRAVSFVTAELGGDSGVIGAAAYARQQMQK
jgi:glucokinase